MDSAAEEVLAEVDLMKVEEDSREEEAVALETVEDVVVASVEEEVAVEEAEDSEAEAEVETEVVEVAEVEPA